MKPNSYPVDKFPIGKKYKTAPAGLSRWDEGDEISCCSFCQCEDPAGYKFVGRGFGHSVDNPHEVFLCEVCYRSWGGNAAEYPDQYEPTALYQMVAQCTNLVLRKVEGIGRDDPTFDATDYAHPAWWRGHDHTMGVVAKQLNEALGCPISEPTGADYGRLKEMIKEKMNER